ncbi:hypothetical protein [Clostridium uliginosum]|uniref:Cyclic lactone autoinducer peptide n=1 Tax=Clostridium uliginosum TaxID=119641 RepID=A0A1I1HUQ7_9CLOT|nr:hypothetical protein [Clostridium uliginosum]SFC27787.1 hypothetical protein SAMN05421842_10219 [Clostridium uliginosum]
MKMKEYIGRFLMMLSNAMITASPASLAGVGVEEMPESMKKFR